MSEFAEEIFAAAEKASRAVLDAGEGADDLRAAVAAAFRAFVDPENNKGDGFSADARSIRKLAGEIESGS